VAYRRTIARFEMFLDHVFDHPVAGAAVTASAAVLRHHVPRGRSRFDGRPDFGLRDGEAHANVHTSVKIMKTTFKCKRERDKKPETRLVSGS